jgi:uncharacterized protein YjbI with pentapeptide repeats
MRFCLLLAFLVSANVGLAGDLGFRYKDGKCLNGEGKEGLNTVYFGQCSDFRSVVLGRVSLEKIDFSGSRFDGATLQLVNFSGATFESVNFEGAQLAGIQFEGAKFNKVTFKQGMLKNVSVSEATMKDVTFENASMLGNTLNYLECKGCSFKNVDLSSSTLESVNFEGSDLTGANISTSTLQGANLSKASLKGVNFKGTNLAGSNLSFAQAVEAKLNSADLSNANLQGLVLDGSDLRKAKFDKADLRGASFNNTDLRGAMIVDCKLEKNSFKGAQFNKRTVLPFNEEQARAAGLIFMKLGDVLVEIKDRTFVKVPVEVNLTDENILKACTDEGLRPPCNDAPGMNFSDDKCLDVGIRDGGSPMRTISQAICKTDPPSCKELDKVFQYMGGMYNGGCGVVGGAWCTDGNITPKGFTICVES